MSTSMDARTGHPSRNQARGPRILLVDDDQGIVAAVKPALAAHHYEITTAADGVEALALFEREHPDLILLDLVMPRLGGLDVCRRIRERSTTPIIVLSVKGSEADIVPVLDLGADDYLVKPFRLAELARNVGRVLTTRLLLERVWGAEYCDETDYVKGVVRRLRVKLEPDPAHPRYILTEPHVGYRLSDS